MVDDIDKQLGLNLSRTVICDFVGPASTLTSTGAIATAKTYGPSLVKIVFQRSARELAIHCRAARGTRVLRMMPRSLSEKHSGRDRAKSCSRRRPAGVGAPSIVEVERSRARALAIVEEHELGSDRTNPLGSQLCGKKTPPIKPPRSRRSPSPTATQAGQRLSPGLGLVLWSGRGKPTAYLAPTCH